MNSYLKLKTKTTTKTKITITIAITTNKQTKSNTHTQKKKKDPKKYIFVADCSRRAPRSFVGEEVAEFCSVVQVLSRLKRPQVG